jgi:hypothetical protein
MQHSILCINDSQHDNTTIMQFHYAECRVLFVAILSIFMLSVVMLSVVMLSVLAPQIIKAAGYISKKLVNIGNSIKVPFYVQNGTAFIKNGATQKISQLIH